VAGKKERKKERKKEIKKERSKYKNNELIRDIEAKELILFRIQSWLFIRSGLLTAINTELPGVG
jgi:hypothetical protein